MEPITAAAVTSLLVTYARHLADVAGQVIDRGLTDGLKELWEAVRRRFATDDQADRALDRMADQPDNTRRQAAVEDHLDELMQADDAFAMRLAELAEHVRLAGGFDNIRIRDAGAVAIGGDVAIRGGRYAAGRDITIAAPGREQPDGHD